MTSQLTYEEARDLIGDGDVVFIRGKWTNPISAAVMFFTGSPLSHVCIAFWVNTTFGKKLMCVEAQGRSKRRTFPLSFYGDHHIDVIRAPKPWNSVRANALSGVGRTEYGMGEAVYIGLTEFLHRHTGRRLPWRHIQREYCSSFVAAVYQLDFHGGSPQVLYDLLRSSYSTSN